MKAKLLHKESNVTGPHRKESSLLIASFFLIASFLKVKAKASKKLLLCSTVLFFFNVPNYSKIRPLSF